MAKVIHIQTQGTVANVCKFIKREPDVAVPMNLKKLQKRVARATGV
jgi:hypothetical protein